MPSFAAKCRPTSAEGDGSGREGYPGSDSTDDVFVYEVWALMMAWTT